MDIPLQKIKKGLRNPREIIMEINARYQWWKMGKRYNPNGVDIFSQDWDILIILDALRADDFMMLNDLPGQVTTKESRGGGTIEFLEGNIKDRDLSDVVYVTGNPQYEANANQMNTQFHKVEQVWKTDWDSELKTVLPKTMSKATICAAEQYPNKRILSHFVQPHEPFIGETAKRHELSGWIDPEKKITGREIFEESMKNLFRQYDTELYRKAYRENIEIALPHVQTILKNVAGKIVVTSDHGEMFGERARPIPIRYDSHRIGCHVPSLLKVPWLEYTNGERRQTVKGETEKQLDASDDVNDRLKQLGYL